MILEEALSGLERIAIRPGGHPVARTVADELTEALASRAVVREVASLREAGGPSTLVVGLADSDLAAPSDDPTGRPWASFRFQRGSGELIASEPHLLYALFARIRDTWCREEAASFADGRRLHAQFTWLAGRDELLTGRLGFLKRRRDPVTMNDVEAGFAELARIGCNHVVINELARRAFETGPAGEVYYRFYDYTPDIDQYVETRLNAGTYPREYLQANLDGLKQMARLAARYGLVPGFYAAHPRSVPDALLERFPFLRGPRIDHTFRSYHPRYVLSLAHPAVRWHQAELIRALLREVPELGFLKMLLNDSGSGYEYTASLYPGRNGGPYIIREWRPDEEIALKAAENVIRYYRSLRDAAREVNPRFEIMAGLKNIAEEQGPILAGMDTGINLQTQSQRSDKADPEWRETRAGLESRGAFVLSDTNATGSMYLLGIPSPWVIAHRLQAEIDRGFDRVDIYLNARHFAPHDINREVLCAFQLQGPDGFDADAAIRAAAVRWVGSDRAPALIDVWRETDAAVGATPVLIQFGWLGFTWYRLWVRPFVPDIDAIPEAERDYYQAHMLSVFNNPANIDFNADALWTLSSVEECDRRVAAFDGKVEAPLGRAVALAKNEARSGGRFWIDLRDRVIALACYTETLRNACAWIAGVHGAIGSPGDRARREMVAQTVARELANTRRLLSLWRESDVDFMPLQVHGESVHHYGLNFGDLLEKKIALMEKYGGLPPRIDPNYLFRAPAGFPVSESDYGRC